MVNVTLLFAATVIGKLLWPLIEKLPDIVNLLILTGAVPLFERVTLELAV